MLKASHCILAAALAAAPAVQAQTTPTPAPAPPPTHNREVARAGLWHIMSSANECTAIYKYDDDDILVALIYPRPGTKADAALMIDSTTHYFTDAASGAPYPARLILTDDDGFDTSLHEIVPTGFVMSSGAHGIRIAAPAQRFADSLAKAEAIRLEGTGRGLITLEVKDMPLMIDAVRKCTAPQ